MKKDERRELAKQQGLTRYEGSPCSVCNNTLRTTCDGVCVECNKRRARERMAEKRKTGAHLEAQYKYEKSEKGTAARKRYYKGSGKERNRESQLRNKYGITVEQYDQMLTEQNHSCKICGTHFDDNGRALPVDHCHTTGRVRALLCDPCNKALGLLKEDINIMKNMIEYVETVC